ncbi:copper resistance protein NlpE [Oligella urethralis]|uniref:Surface-adhesin protein E-like domain-containing protein n=1 Tax=Oligella urethralis DNF00040 TaxID=1401065 RepID=A0A095ZAU9_9BURK|nr:surface-adhesin E family protein [Oligella urethralis]KGF31481.1 hypothetical protein HMPREF2130_03005 [Oligella urethralis DNF00040]
MKKLAFALVGVVAALSSACAQATKEAQPQAEEMSVKEAVADASTEAQANADPTPHVVDWDGRWSGVIPCGHCAGIEVDLIFNTDGTYLMREAELESPHKVSVNKGSLSWDEATRVLTFNGYKGAKGAKLRMQFAEGLAFYLDAQGNLMPDYQLSKQAEYRASSQQLILPLQSIRVEDNHVFFSGLLNFKEPQNGGFKSVKGEVMIDCAKQHVSFKDAGYYPEADALGERIVDVPQMVKGGWKLGSNSEESVFLQVAETFCPTM